MQRSLTFLLLLHIPIIVESKYEPRRNKMYKNHLQQHRQAPTSINTTWPHIISGEPAAIGEFPWFGRTEIAFSDGSVYSCGGSLVHSDIVITAAHCIADLEELPLYEYSIVFNLGAIQYDGSDGDAMIVEKAIWPSSYNFPESDIAFYKISTTNVVPVEWNTDPNIPIIGAIGTAMGFGATDNFGGGTDVLLKVDLPAITNEECDAASESITCVDTPNDDRDTCVGDSGGPILTSDGILYGVTSYGGDECGSSPSGFTRTSYFNVLIEKVICTYSSDPPALCAGTDSLLPGEVVESIPSGEVPTPSPEGEACGFFGFFCLLFRLFSFLFG